MTKATKVTKIKPHVERNEDVQAQEVIVEKHTKIVETNSTIEAKNPTFTHWQSYVLYGVCAVLITLNVLIIIENGNNHASILTSLQVVIALVASIMALLIVVGLVLGRKWPLYKAYGTAGVITVIHFFVCLSVVVMYGISRRRGSDMGISVNLVIYETLTLICYVVSLVFLHFTLKRIDENYSFKQTIQRIRNKK